MANAPTRLRGLQVATLAALSFAALAGSARAETTSSDAGRRSALGIVVPDARSDAAALMAARDRSVRVAARLAGLKQAARPGHLFDPVAGDDRGSALETLRSDYLDLQRKAAGYRVTLGERHPTLVAAEQVMTDVRTRIHETLNRELVEAGREDAQARRDADAIEQRLRDRLATEAASSEATGSIGAASSRGDPRAMAPSSEAWRSADAAPVLRGSASGDIAPATVESEQPVATASPASFWLGGDVALGLLTALGLAGAGVLAVRRWTREEPAARLEPQCVAPAATTWSPPAPEDAGRAVLLADRASVAGTAMLPVGAAAWPAAVTSEDGRRTGELRTPAGSDAMVMAAHAAFFEATEDFLAFPAHDAAGDRTDSVALLLTFAPAGAPGVILVSLPLESGRPPAALRPAVPRRFVARDHGAGPVYGVAADGRIVALNADRPDTRAALHLAVPAHVGWGRHGAAGVEIAVEIAPGIALETWPRLHPDGLDFVSGPEGTIPVRFAPHGPALGPASQPAAPIGLRPSFAPTPYRLSA